jgi:hypothetical protein
VKWAKVKKKEDASQFIYLFMFVSCFAQVSENFFFFLVWRTYASVFASVSCCFRVVFVLFSRFDWLKLVYFSHLHL